MVSVNLIKSPFKQKVRNIASLKESLRITTEQAKNLYDRLISGSLEKESIDNFITQLENAGWKFMSEESSSATHREIFCNEAKDWYDNLSSKEREYIAYFQRMMIPSL